MITKERIEEKRKSRSKLYSLIQSDIWYKEPEKVKAVQELTKEDRPSLERYKRTAEKRKLLPDMDLRRLTRKNFIYLKSLGYTNMEITRSVHKASAELQRWIKANDIGKRKLNAELDSMPEFSEEDMRLPVTKKYQAEKTCK